MNYYKSDFLTNSIKKNFRFYFAATIFFTIGIAAGAIIVKALDYNQKKDLVVFLNKFFQIMDKEDIKNSTIFYQSIKNNFQTVFFIWILSITVIGIPVTLFITSFRGFIIGFSVSFFIIGMGWKGLLLNLIAILPQNIIYVPCIIAISAVSLRFSLNILKRNLTNGAVNQIKNSILLYSISISILFFVMCFGSLIEAYLSPIFLKSISSFIITQ